METAGLSPAFRVYHHWTKRSSSSGDGANRMQKTEAEVARSLSAALSRCLQRSWASYFAEHSKTFLAFVLVAILALAPSIAFASAACDAVAGGALNHSATYSNGAWKSVV